MSELTPGLKAETELTVTDADTAARWGSGLVPVYSTPALVGQMENSAVVALTGHIPAGQTTVGGHIEVHHLAPTPVGMKVRVMAELVEVDGRKLVFKIEAWDEVEKIGEATHDRFIVDEAKFIAKVKSKSGQ
jgi:predicted thioesterase